MKYDIFISYRREGGYETAKHLYDLLRLDGYSVSFDIDTLGNGTFDTELYRRIDECDDFIVILSKGAFDRCSDPSVSLENDWLRNELAYAVRKDKNIIPVIGSDFEFPAALPEDIAKIKYYNGVVYNRAYFDAMYAKLKTFLRATPAKKGLKKFYGLLALFIVVIAVIFISRTGEKKSRAFVESAGDVVIKASLLDSSFVRTDSLLSKILTPDDYFGMSEEIDIDPFYKSFHYTDSFINDTCLIVPWGKYVGDYYSGNHISMVDPTFNILGEDYYTNTHYPMLDVKLVNNSGETIVIDKLVIAVEESRIDSRPFVIVSESAGQLSFSNRGWPEWSDCKFRFSLSAKKPDTPVADYTFETDLPFFAPNDTIAGFFLNMYDYLEASGVDFNRIKQLSIAYSAENDKEIPWWSAYYESTDVAAMEALDSLKKILAPIELDCDSEDMYEYDEAGEERLIPGAKRFYFGDPGLWLSGVLDFDNGRHIISVDGFVRILSSEGYGAPALEVNRKFDVRFKDEGINYTVDYPVSRILKNGEGDRIVLQLDADKTTHHHFKVRLDNINGHTYESNPVDLLIFKYRL